MCHCECVLGARRRGGRTAEFSKIGVYSGCCGVAMDAIGNRAAPKSGRRNRVIKDVIGPKSHQQQPEKLVLRLEFGTNKTYIYMLI